MSDISQSEKNLRKKVNKWIAIAAIVFAILSLLLAFILGFTCGFYRLIRNIVVCSTVGLSLVFAILIPFRLSGKWNRYQWIAFAAILVSCFVLIEGVYAPWRNNYYVDSICHSHMANIGKAMKDYTERNNGQFPSAFQWCDILMNSTQVYEKDFICPTSYWPVFSYGFNKNLSNVNVNDVSPETVVLFEIEGGRNVSGGAELMQVTRHWESGSNILFADFHTAFVKRERIKDLQWEVPAKPDEK
jgi:prepilin-type processing-associated H-X9-DG protein